MNPSIPGNHPEESAVVSSRPKFKSADAEHYPEEKYRIVTLEEYLSRRRALNIITLLIFFIGVGVTWLASDRSTSSDTLMMFIIITVFALFVFITKVRIERRMIMRRVSRTNKKAED